jgi:hypothetical protein
MRRCIFVSNVRLLSILLEQPPLWMGKANWELAKNILRGEEMALTVARGG